MKPGRILRAVWLPLLFAGFAAAVLVGSRGLNPVAGTTPGIIAGATLALLVLHIIRNFRAALESATGDEATAPGKRHADWLALSWLAILCLTVWLFGLAPGLAVFCLGMMRFQFKESWRVSIGFALIIGLGLQATFYLLEMPLYAGLAATWLP